MGETTRYSYDEAGNLVEKIEPEGQRTVYEYNSADELIGVKHYSSSGATTPEKTVSFSYDKAGNLLSYDDGTTSASFSYDAFGRRTNSMVDYGPFQLSHGTTYTESGRRKSLNYPDGSTYSYGYNQADRLASMDLPGSGEITFGDYEWRRPTSVTLPGGGTKSYKLDPLQRIKEITSRDPAGNTVLYREYDYDRAGNIVSEQTGEGRRDYGYDPLDRLTRAENPALPDEEYSYDPVDNRLTSANTNGTWSYNPNNELLAYNNATCSFDDNGNMVKRVVNGVTTRYIYNVNNRLARVEDGSGNVIVRYYYDPFGRRLWKEVDGERTYFLYSKQGLIAEYDDQGDPIRFYGYKPGSSWTTDPLFLKKEWNYYFYHNDNLGTSQKLTTSNGQVVWLARYTSFGVSQLVKQKIKNPLRFPGQYYDRETRLHYNFHRYYDPRIGKYLNADPIGLAGGMNVYIYTNNNPLIYRDVKGLIYSPISEHGAKWDSIVPQKINIQGGMTLFLNNFEIYETKNDCRYICWSLTTDLIGAGASVPLTEKNNDSPIDVTIGSGKYGGISFDSKTNIDINIGASFGIPGGSINVRLICFKLTDKNKNGCPCKSNMQNNIFGSH